MILMNKCGDSCVIHYGLIPITIDDGIIHVLPSEVSGSRMVFLEEGIMVWSPKKSLPPPRLLGQAGNLGMKVVSFKLSEILHFHSDFFINPTNMAPPFPTEWIANP